jgi:hypothetical protein
MVVIRTVLRAEPAAEIHLSFGEDRVERVPVISQLTAVEAGLKHRDHLSVGDTRCSARRVGIVCPVLRVVHDVRDMVAAAVGVRAVDVEVGRSGEVVQEKSDE